MEITNNRIKNITKINRVFPKKLGFFTLNLKMIKTVTTALLLLLGLASIFPLTAMAAAPAFNGAILRVVLASNDNRSSVTTVDVLKNFSDADNDTLAYTAVSANTGVATVTVSGSKVTITRVAAGETTVAVTASDGSSTATQLIDVRVYSLSEFTMNKGRFN